MRQSIPLAIGIIAGQLVSDSKFPLPLAVRIACSVVSLTPYFEGTLVDAHELNMLISECLNSEYHCSEALLVLLERVREQDIHSIMNEFCSDIVSNEPFHITVHDDVIYGPFDTSADAVEWVTDKLDSGCRGCFAVGTLCPPKEIM